MARTVPAWIGFVKPSPYAFWMSALFPMRGLSGSPDSPSREHREAWRQLSPSALECRSGSVSHVQCRLFQALAGRARDHLSPRVHLLRAQDDVSYTSKRSILHGTCGRAALSTRQRNTALLGSPLTIASLVCYAWRTSQVVVPPTCYARRSVWDQSFTRRFDAWVRM